MNVWRTKDAALRAGMLHAGEEAHKAKAAQRGQLIRYGRDWQVCCQARGKLGTQRVTAWVFGPDSTFFCKVGDQAEIIMLPEKDACMGDQYHFTIDRTDQDGIPIERIGGATNVDAAIAASRSTINRAPRRQRGPGAADQKLLGPSGIRLPATLALNSRE